jgi:hypothetical protein
VGRAPATPCCKSARRLYGFGPWPFASTASKPKAYQTTLAAFLAAVKTLEPPHEAVKIPFEGREIAGYLRVPKAASGPTRLVFAISGLDSRKENLMDQFAPVLSEGIAILPSIVCSVTGRGQHGRYANGGPNGMSDDAGITGG